MSRASSSTRQRLVNAALELFTSQGFTETTTRQIAELAQVNEVTLFRHFGNKQGLLLAVIEDSAVFTHLGETLRTQANQTSDLAEALKNYASDRIQALEKIPELLRSVVGEAGQYTVENRRALGRGVTLANREVARYLATVIEREHLQPRISAEKLASLLNEMLFGYMVIELTSELHELWNDREDFLENLVELFLYGGIGFPELQVKELPEDSASDNGLSGYSPKIKQSGLTRPTSAQDADADSPNPVNSSLSPPQTTTPYSNSSTEQHITSEGENVGDLPATLVHTILQQSKKKGLQEYALAYVLFSAGLTVPEIVTLERSHQISDTHQHLLQVNYKGVRQVPVNQWIMGKRYGSYTRNPLTQWLKSRKDEQEAVFVNEAGQPMSEDDLRATWQNLTSGLLTPEGQPIRIEQARQTWCVEMLMRGIDLEDLCILSGWDCEQLQPYASKAREKIALERALRLDHKA
jgi:AcrR family transcriptional regulator